MKVVIVQQLLAQYRVPFFDGLRRSLAESGIELALVHGQATGARAARRDEAALPWATKIANRSVELRGHEIAVWQPARHFLHDADLVIVEHANRLLLNYLLMALRPPRLAFWGHGANLQSSAPNGIRERFKRATALQADWYFAYTAGCADRVARIGFPSERICVVNNSIQISEADPVPRKPHSAVYVGALDAFKRIDFLLEAAELVRYRIPDFSLEIAGDGPERDRVATAASRADWITYHGPVYGVEKQKLLQGAEILLVPGLVGLVAVDSFGARTPIVTLADSRHSPEYEYLSRQNAMVVRDANLEAYATSVAELLRDGARLRELRRGCAESGERYGLDAMIRNFAGGVENALLLDSRTKASVTRPKQFGCGRGPVE